MVRIISNETSVFEMRPSLISNSEMIDSHDESDFGNDIIQTSPTDEF